MEDQTPNLSLPYIMPSQAQKHVTHNEAIRRLDVLTQLVVESRTLNTPPSEPDNGFVYIIPDNANGAWEERAHQIAAFQDGAYVYLTPREGWRAFIKGEGLAIFSNGGWSLVSGNTDDLNDITLLGVNTTADETNRLSVRADAILLTHENNDMRAVMNKAQTSDTASFLFQTGFSGRAELGLTGDDQLHVKVSADGTTFQDAMIVENATARPDFPNGFARNGITSDTLAAAHAQVPVLSGPTSVRFDASSKRLHWSGRFVSIASGSGSHYSTNGFFQIDFPTIGTLVTGSGGAPDDTITADGILLDEWEALYYVLPIGGDHSSIDGSFRRAHYSASFMLPDDEVWVFLALHNGDTGEIRLGNGEIIYQSTDSINRHEDRQAVENFPVFHAYNLDAATLPSRLIFTQTQVNNGNIYDAASGLFTAPRAGIYRFDCAALIDTSNTQADSFSLTFRKNGADIAAGRSGLHEVPSDNIRGLMSSSTTIALTEGDTIEAYATGGNLWSGDDLNSFSGHMIAAT